MARLQQKEQELAAVVASQAVSQQQEEELKQVEPGCCSMHRHAAEREESEHTSSVFGSILQTTSDSDLVLDVVGRGQPLA